MTYDPLAAGCECWRCPLQGRDVVPPELRPGAKLLLIGRDPGISEEEDGRPFAGVFGRQVERSLGFAGASRSDTSITNLRLCRLPKGSPKDWHASSLDACRPRLLREIAAHPALLLFGADAIHELYGADAEQLAAPVDLDGSDLEDDPREAASVGEAGLFALRGFPLRVLGKPAIATFLAPRMKRWIPVLDSDVAKAVRLAAGRLDWTEPEIVLDPTLGELDGVLERFSRDGQLVITDTETGDPRDPTTDDYGEWAKEPLRAALRCIGLGNRDLSICVPYRSLETPPRRFRIDTRAATDRLNNFYRTHPRHGGHNIQKFDRPLLDRYGLRLPDYAHTIDTLTGHHVSDSEMPHGLDFLSSRYTDSPKHKPGHRHKWRSDRELHHYCCLDTVVNARCAPAIFREIVATDQLRTYKADVNGSRFCAEAHRVGMFIDIAERERHRVRLEAARAAALAKLQQVAGRAVNPRSPDQVRDWLFKEIGLPWPSIETPTGRPSTGKDAVYEMLSKALPERARNFLEHLLDYRRPDKMLSAFIETANPWHEDRRIHPFWSEHVQTGGRYSAKGPAVQTIPSTKTDSDSLRSMFRAAPGNILVYADKAQLELRLITIAMRDPVWWAVFTEGKDLHNINACTFFGIKSPGDVTAFIRDFSKILIYLFDYRGGAKTAHKNILKVRDAKAGKRPYADFTLAQTEQVRDRLLADHPELPRWWSLTDATFKKQKFLRTWLLKRLDGPGFNYEITENESEAELGGRIRKFLDLSGSTGGEEEDELAGNEKYSFPISGAAGDLMGGHGALGRLMETLPWGVYGPGILFHGHDSLMVEVEARHEQYARECLREAMTDSISIPGSGLPPMPLPCDLRSGLSWADLH